MTNIFYGGYENNEEYTYPSTIQIYVFVLDVKTLSNKDETIKIFAPSVSGIALFTTFFISLKSTKFKV